MLSGSLIQEEIPKRRILSSRIDLFTSADKAKINT
jgi:hypothetical protein